MTDYEYDQLMSEIKEENPSFDIFEYVRYEQDGERREHTVVFPNFEKVEFDRLQTEYDQNDMVLTCKYDGASVIAYYSEDGSLQNIMTRSNERDGIVQTRKLWNKVPHNVNPSIKAILFEATVEGKRSDANGLINSKYLQERVDDELFLNPFDVILRKRALGYIDRMNLTGLHYDVLTIQQAVGLKQQGDEPVIRLEREGKERNIPVDGIVVYSKTEPFFGRIYKFYATDAKSSVVTALHFDPSRETGLNNVVVEFEPVRIGSINVKRCGNAGSWKTIREKKLGVGSRVKVFLTKVTIPQIRENTPWTEEPIPTCPWCDQPLEEFQGKLVCKNLDCGFWEDFFETKYFNILREKKGDEWVDEYTVQKRFDIYMMARAEKITGYTLSGFIMHPQYLYYLIKPPRVGGKVYEELKQRIQARAIAEKPKDTFQLAEIILSCIYNDNQREYCEMVWDKLVYFLRKVTRIRKNLP